MSDFVIHLGWFLLICVGGVLTYVAAPVINAWRWRSENDSGEEG